MKVSEAARRELATLPDIQQKSALAAAVMDLARRLDGGPGDRDAVDLARELRMTLAALHARAESRPEEVLDVGDPSMGH